MSPRHQSPEEMAGFSSFLATGLRFRRRMSFWNVLVGIAFSCFLVFLLQDALVPRDIFNEL